MKKWYVTGDTHGRWDNLFMKLQKVNGGDALIILGDAGFNYYLNKTDRKLKEKANLLGVTIYCVRGNHEQRPELIDSMVLRYDEEVDNTVYVELEYPNIRYFRDGATYTINGYKTLVLGGAYSIDKYYRLSMGYTWFEQEQLNADELKMIENQIYDDDFDFVLTHTCPASWQPTDLFFRGIDQNTVDNTMEYWLNYMKNNFTWKYWLFGHYHADRMIRPKVEMYYNQVESIDNIVARWDKYDKNEDFSTCALEKDPHFHWR